MQVRAAQGIKLSSSQKGKQTCSVTSNGNHIIKLLSQNSVETPWQNPVSLDKILLSFLPDFPFSSCRSPHPLTSAVNEVKIQDPTDNRFLPDTALIQPRAGLTSAFKKGKKSL